MWQSRAKPQEKVALLFWLIEIVFLYVLILVICVNTCYNNNCKGER